MKAAISIPDNLLEQVDQLTAQRHIARSRIISEAVRQYLEKEFNKKLQKTINRCFEQSPEDETLQKHHKRYYRRRIVQKW